MNVACTSGAVYYSGLNGFMFRRTHAARTRLSSSHVFQGKTQASCSTRVNVGPQTSQPFHWHPERITHQRRVTRVGLESRSQYGDGSSAGMEDR
jgi:hypothetical protein